MRCQHVVCFACLAGLAFLCLLRVFELPLHWQQGAMATQEYTVQVGSSTLVPGRWLACMWLARKRRVVLHV